MNRGAVIKRATVLLVLFAGVLEAAFLMSAFRGQEDKSMTAATAFASVLPEEISGWKKSRADQIFGRDNIFDYMDGAGEIYLAYDFRFVFMSEYARGNAPSLVVEIYQMTSSEDAFGVFTQDLDGDAVHIGQDALYAAGLLRFWKDRIFVRILADKETPEIKLVIMKLGEMIAASVPGEGNRPDLISVLPSEGQRPRTLRYFHTLISLNSHYFLASENILNLSPETRVVLAQYEQEKSRARLLVIEYPSVDIAEDAQGKFVRIYLEDKSLPEGKVRLQELEDGRFSGILRKDTFLIIVLGSEALPLCQWLFEETSQKLEGKN